MTKLTRRHMLLTGMAAGIAGSGLTSVHPGVAQPTQSQPSLPTTNTDLFDYDGNSQTGGENRTNPATQTQPLLPYDRAISELLVLCTSLAIEQFQASQADSRYDGSIRTLPGYSSQLDGYTQVASFDSFQSSPNILGEVGELFDRILSSRRRVFIGFALTSPQHNIAAFRGTLNPSEWIGNLRTNQSSFTHEGTKYGDVHRGFLSLYNRLNDQVLTAVQKFALNIPCYFTGHSLGGALATLAAASSTLSVPALRSQAQLYTYASPRVGNSTFAQFYNQQVPNSYRVLNLGDTVPMTPPSRVKRLEFVHVGQPWVFLSQTGDIVPNHAIPLYQTAIAKAIETNQLTAYGLS